MAEVREGDHIAAERAERDARPADVVRSQVLAVLTE